MSLDELCERFTWSKFSKKLEQKVSRRFCCGHFTQADAQARGMRLAEASAGDLERGHHLKLYWLVDPEDGIIVDARYQVFGPISLIAALEATCELCISKNYDQLRRTQAELIDAHFRDKGDKAAFPVEANSYLNLCLEAIDACAMQCTDIPFSHEYSSTPLPNSPPIYEGEVLEGGLPGWEDMDEKTQLGHIQAVLEKDILPYVALDGGGVELLKLIEGKELLIAYQGACNGCFASTGSTLSSIQNILRAKVHPNLTVVPEL